MLGSNLLDSRLSGMEDCFVGHRLKMVVHLPTGCRVRGPARTFEPRRGQIT